MRDFIKGCAGLFVSIGMIVFGLAALIAFFTLLSGGGVAIVGGLGVALSAAGITLVGGTAYMLCSIDARLEQMATSAIRTP